MQNPIANVLRGIGSPVDVFLLNTERGSKMTIQIPAIAALLSMGGMMEVPKHRPDPRFKGINEKRGRIVARSQVVSNPHKVGRNDPCPCGCGRKFKHCQSCGM